MRKRAAAIVPVLLLAGCGETANEVATEHLESAAEASADVNGFVPVALGLSEAQLLDADVIGPANVALGEVNGLIRGASGKVDALIVEVEGSNPDRFVRLPLDGLTVIRRGTDHDIATMMTRAQFARLPDAQFPPR